ncbi:serine hydrolase domain-containing protein [Sediminicoccus rosea]|uniref:Serine hydrolase domain-containing protein n=1 Tax=Sediminicoccus rosea TaxID=1225128 RepID=A0ABZ0PQ68_9PROT|nr:serine hydrolase domain-containing protein [Sediminicoccus rosea]WPB87321.1 serine hydrolase domain-containing protein [Sediminicoccus rosea]
MQRRHLALMPAGLLAMPAIATAQEAERSQDLVQGFSRARLARFQPAMAREVERGSFNGCVALIARNGQIIHHEAYGHQDNARRVPMTREAIFLLASMTKPITSVAAMMLVEEGRMKIGDPITQWLPELRELKVMTRDGEVPLARPITVQDLLRHSSGFVYAASSPFPRIREMYEELDIEARRGPVPADEMLRRLGTVPLAFQPGAQFFYSISTDVLGLLLQRVAGQPLDQLIAERLTRPLGMTDTVWWVDAARRSRVAESIASDPLSTPMWNSYRIEQNPVPAGHFKGGAGLVGTSADYFRFAQMIANGGSFEGKRYLSAPTVNWMLSDHMGSMGGTPQASTGPGYGFGLGFAVRREQGISVAPGSPGDAMWAGAWGTSFTIDRAEKLVGVFMAQGPSSRMHTRMVFKNMVYGAMVESLRG